MRKLSYRPGTSLVHQLYPLTKFVWLILVSIIVFILTNGWLLISNAAILLVILLAIYPTIWRIRGFRFALLTGVMLFILYPLFDKSGQLIFDPGVKILTVTTTGIEMGLRISGRFLSIVFLSYIFILTTEPSELAYSLIKIGFPYRFGFILVTALRLSPILEDEGRTIYQAQLVRGVRYDQGNIKKFLNLIQQFLSPLLISALRRADNLVFSMEGRGFGKYTVRTFRDQTSPKSLDLMTSICISLYFAFLIIINYGA